MGINTFSKSERLCSKKIIKELFSEGSSFYLFPFKVYFLPAPTDALQHQVLFSVPKRSFKRAVDRNKLKRKIREAYRLNKHMISDGNKMSIAYIYTAKEQLDYQTIEPKLKNTLLRLHKQATKRNEE